MVGLCRAALILSAAFLLAITVLSVFIRSFEREQDSLSFTYYTSVPPLTQYDKAVQLQTENDDLIELKTDLAMNVVFHLNLWSQYGLTETLDAQTHQYLSEVFAIESKREIMPDGTQMLRTNIVYEEFDEVFADLRPYLEFLSFRIESRAKERYDFRNRLVAWFNGLLGATIFTLLAAIFCFERVQSRQQKTPA